MMLSSFRGSFPPVSGAAELPTRSIASSPRFNSRAHSRRWTVRPCSRRSAVHPIDNAGYHALVPLDDGDAVRLPYQRTAARNHRLLPWRALPHERPGAQVERFEPPARGHAGRFRQFRAEVPTPAIMLQVAAVTHEFQLVAPV